jgi:F-type H+-transporting ATPase subunit alpha
VAVLEKGRRNVEILKQPQYSPYRVEQQIAILYCGTHNLMKDVPLDKVREFEKEFLEKLEVTHKNDVLEPLSKGTINDDITKAIETLASDVAANYKQ